MTSPKLCYRRMTPQNHPRARLKRLLPPFLQNLCLSNCFLVYSSVVPFHPLTSFLLQNNYAFVEFENEEDAAKAKEELQDKDMSGLKINIGKFMRVLIVKFLISEWSKKSTKFEGKSGGRDVGKSDRPRRDDRRDRDDIVCYNCDRRGHFQRDCKQR